jgi:cell division protein ZapA
VSAEANGDDSRPAAAGPRTSVRVSIVGDDYTLRSDAPEAHTRAVAAYVDQVIRQVLGTGSVVESHKAAILAALQITDELMRARADAEAVAERARVLAADVRRWLPPAKRGDGSDGADD